jgi:hypothetical protein
MTRWIRCRCGATHSDELAVAECTYTLAAQDRVEETAARYRVAASDARDLWSHLRSVEPDSALRALPLVETVLALGWRPVAGRDGVDALLTPLAGVTP